MNELLTYSWEYYATDIEKEEAWKFFIPYMKEELHQYYRNSNPSLQITYEYWRRRMDEEWHKVAMLDWLFSKTGRPNTTLLDRQGLKTVCEFHLEGCLQQSFDNCDLYEGKYSVIDKKTCEECGDRLQAGDYEKYCKYCWDYRNNSI